MQEEHMDEWKLKRKIDGKKEVVFTLPGKFNLKPGKTVKIWARGNGGTHSPPDALVFDGEDNWGLGHNVQTILYNKEGEVRFPSLLFPSSLLHGPHCCRSGPRTSSGRASRRRRPRLTPLPLSPPHHCRPTDKPKKGAIGPAPSSPSLTQYWPWLPPPRPPPHPIPIFEPIAAPLALRHRLASLSGHLHPPYPLALLIFRFISPWVHPAYKHGPVPFRFLHHVGGISS